MAKIQDILGDALQKGASDIFIVSGSPLAFRLGGQVLSQSEQVLNPEDTMDLVKQIYSLACNQKYDHFVETGDADFSFSISGVGRFRVSAFLQRGSHSAVLRVVRFDLPDIDTLGIPQTVIDLHKFNRGLVLVTGPAGSGKSTTLSCIIDRINHTRKAHIITLEDPLEFLHKHDKSIVSQREISNDTADYAKALRSALRQSPNVILLGEMRDYDTISIAMTAAETGQLVFSTLHTIGAANTIDRVIDVFPPNQQYQIRTQLSMVLQAVVSQQLLPATDGTLVPAFEIMLVNNAIRNMIRESKIHQIDSVIYAAANEGMCTMDASILSLYNEGRITADTALRFCSNIDIMQKRVSE
ncbi:MAG TPA: PilT/PilU family type 4a pilus ATPase [Oscillospiraceae bacterium]|nr:PilT/PilU family type 4a pilus ATPase [Oscillospiraceae bacterium]